MSTRPVIRSFAGGEITPELYGRFDLTKFQIGLKTCRNFLVKPQGPVENRYGFIHDIEAKFATGNTRVIEFAIDANTTMAIEIGNLYFRFHRNGQPAREAAKVVTAATNAIVGVFTSVAHSYNTGDWVYVQTTWNNAINGRYCRVFASSPNTYQLITLENDAVFTLTWGVFTAMTTERVYEIATPYIEADAFNLHFEQSGSTMTFTHPSYKPQDLTRVTDTNWSLTNSVVLPTIGAPTGAAAVPTLAGAVIYNYKVTATGANNIDEGAVSNLATCTNDLSLAGHYNTVSWIAVAGASRYTVYKESNGIYGYIGQAGALTFIDDNIEPDISQSPPVLIDPFNAAGDYPSAVTYFEQRRIFGGTINRPLNIWTTKSGTDNNISYSIPLRDTDSIIAKVYSRLASTIRHLVPLSNLVVLTSGVEFRTVANNSDALTPANISFKPDSYEGSSNVRPVTAGSSILVPAARGGHIQEISYNWQSSGNKSEDISVLATHLFDGYTIVDMAYSKAPYKFVWAVRSDGMLLGLTYLPEQEVAAWHHHDAADDGLFKSVCNVSESTADSIYAVIQRVINGRTVKYIEYSNLSPTGARYMDSSRLGSTTSLTTYNLWHLAGRSVKIVRDGEVLPDQTVGTDGVLTLTGPIGAVTYIGLGYESDIETMPLVLATQDGSFRQGSQSNVNAVYLRLVESSGLFAGPSFDKLKEYKQRTTEPMGSPPAVINGMIKLNLTPSWNYDAPVCVRQANPLRMTITAMTIDVALGS